MFLPCHIGRLKQIIHTEATVENRFQIEYYNSSLYRNQFHQIRNISSIDSHENSQTSVPTLCKLDW